MPAFFRGSFQLSLQKRRPRRNKGYDWYEHEKRPEFSHPAEIEKASDDKQQADADQNNSDNYRIFFGGRAVFFHTVIMDCKQAGRQ